VANLDTRSKRASSVGVLVGFFVLAPVLPDAAITQGDRQHIAVSYSGILATGSAPPAERGYVLTKDDRVILGSKWAACPALRSVQTFAASATWARPAGIASVLVQVQAAGAYGGSATGGVGQASAGGGGGAGEFAWKFVASPAASATVIVGANGAPGGDSSWDDGTVLVEAVGGAAGVDGTATTLSVKAGGAGGAGGSGDVVAPGPPGDPGLVLSALVVYGGIGGSSHYGAGGQENANGAGYGAGGGGASVVGNSAVDGPSGTDGLVVVLEFGHDA
jgi:hypothetical protein